INKMAKYLIRMCDAVEKHSLVDYQYGVAEEQIIMSRKPPGCRQRTFDRVSPRPRVVRTNSGMGGAPRCAHNLHSLIFH
ncbi:hypothetical protein DL98DRAFT_443188, partial [Cadophora sp. DSE1049]